MDTQQVGETAGRVWQHLAKGGPSLLKDLPKAVGTAGEIVVMAVGWLAREDKVLFQKKGKEIQVQLTQAELKTLGA